MQQTSSPISSRRRFLKNAAITLGTFTIVPRYVLGKGFIAPSDQINLGLIGAGRKSKNLASSFIKTGAVRILAVSDVFEEKMRTFQEQVTQLYAQHQEIENYNSVQAYFEFEDLLSRSDIDGVIVASPDHWHAAMSIAAMKAGKDVYCEKPLSRTIKEGRAMVEAARKYQRIFQTGSQQRSNRNFRHACELVRNGYLGEIKKVLVNVGDPSVPYNLSAEPIPNGLNWDRWCGPAPKLNYHSDLAPVNNNINYWPKWRMYTEYGGGILADWGAHMFDIAQWALGMDHTAPIEWIPPSDPNAKRGLRMIYANGVEMVHEDFNRSWAVRFIGTKGSLDVSRQFLDSQPESIVSATIKEGEQRLYHSDNHYQNWLDSIKSRKTPICDVEIGHRSCSVCKIADIAYALRRPLKWDPEKEAFIGNKAANKMRGGKWRRSYRY